jgi:hypothetical protein
MKDTLDREEREGLRPGIRCAPNAPSFGVVWPLPNSLGPLSSPWSHYVPLWLSLKTWLVCPVRLSSSWELSGQHRAELPQWAGQDLL